MREQQRRRSCEEGARGSNDQRHCGQDFDGSRGREVATGACDIVNFVPQVQKELFHVRAPLYGSTPHDGVRTLTVTQTPRRLAGTQRRAYALVANRVTTRM